MNNHNLANLGLTLDKLVLGRTFDQAIMRQVNMVRNR
jgi:hypothetical protein